jgi:hypothetical protein
MKTLIVSLVASIGLVSASAAPAKKAKSSNKAFKALIEKNHRTFDRCADAERLRSKRPLKGVVLVRFVVNGDGKVVESGPVHNTTKSRALAECLVHEIDRMTFPKSFGAKITATHPFKYTLKAKKKKK